MHAWRRIVAKDTGGQHRHLRSTEHYRFRGYADCVEGAEEKGVIYGTGVYQPGEIKKSPVFKQAYEMGKSVR